MTVDDFLSWALDSSRTVDERCALEQISITGVNWMAAKRKKPQPVSWDKLREQARYRRLNPAYEPKLKEADLRDTFEAFTDRKQILIHLWEDRPMRSIEWLRFFPETTELNLDNLGALDFTPLQALPKLKKLSFTDSEGEDYRPIGKCTSLENLRVNVGSTWVMLDGWEQLTNLREFAWLGNIHNLGSIPSLPAVIRASFVNSISGELPIRNAHQLPEMPLLEFLRVKSIFRLDGIERYPKLRNAIFHGPLRSAEPLAALHEVTALFFETDVTRETIGHSLITQSLPDLRPLAGLPKLHIVRFKSPVPRDYSPLAEVPNLHELTVEGCAAVEMEVAAIAAGLPSWDELFLAPQPRPLPPLKIRYAEPSEANKREEETNPPEWNEDPSIRSAEAQWLIRWITKRMDAVFGEGWGRCGIGVSDSWHLGLALPNPHYRTEMLTITSQDTADRLREVIEVARQVLAETRCRWNLTLVVSLELSGPDDDDEIFFDDDDEEEFERRNKEIADFREKQHQLELAKQAGQKVNPEEFALSKVPPPDDGDDDDDDDEGGIGDDFFDDQDHPLADEYYCGGMIYESEVIMYARFREVAEWLLGDKK